MEIRVSGNCLRSGLFRDVHVKYCFVWPVIVTVFTQR